MVMATVVAVTVCAAAVVGMAVHEMVVSWPERGGRVKELFEPTMGLSQRSTKLDTKVCDLQAGTGWEA